MDRVVNRQTTWYIINIKARRNQTPQHYVDAWNLINEQDPTKTISFRRFAHPFQKFSKASTKSDFCVSIQGISSKNTTFFLLAGKLPRCSSSASKASNQSAYFGTVFNPAYCFIAFPKLRS